jgi:hypothetical protein
MRTKYDSIWILCRKKFTLTDENGILMAFEAPFTAFVSAMVVIIAICLGVGIIGIRRENR